MDIIEKAIQLADDLGIRIIQLAGYEVCYEEDTTESERLFREDLAKAILMASAGQDVIVGTNREISEVAVHRHGIKRTISRRYLRICAFDLYGLL